jgi:molybdopterin-guanine dinucleotide biosynthesis protein A
MGRDKATLLVGGKPLLRRVYEVVEPLFEEVFIISNRHEPMEGVRVPVLKDLVPGKGPLVGIASALLYTTKPYLFVVACDMPFLSRESVLRVVGEVGGEDIVIPRTRNGYEALHAVYNRSCASVMLKHVGEGRMKISKLFPYFSVREVGECPEFVSRGLSVFTNVNSADDMEMAEAQLAAPSGDGDPVGPARASGDM